MRQYVLRRFLHIIPVLLIVTFLVFALMWAIPGDPVRAFIGPGEALDAKQLEVLRREHHLDQPLLVRYVIWLADALAGDLGRSTINNRLVAQEVGERAVITPIDYLATVISIGAVAVPGFWLGIMAILLFGVTLGWLPTQGYVSLFDDPLEGLRHMLLPAFSLGITSCALIMRQTRSAMLEVLAQDYIRTARAKGLAERVIIWIHALRNSLLPVVTVLGLQTGRIFAGAVVIETLFRVPGMGQLMVQAIFQQDFTVVQGSVLVMALAVLLANLATDVAYAWLDPRIKYDG